MQAAGLKVVPWTVNEVSYMKKLMSWGVDGIITDYPDRLMKLTTKTMKKYDVCAIGNALVDYEIEVAEQFFADNEVEKGLMTLVDEQRQVQLLGKVDGQIKKKQGGGSAANTIFGMSAFGGKGYYTCKVANDEDGALYVGDLEKSGIDSNLDTAQLPSGTTGKCLVMITPDAERTMNTFLGITTDFSVAEIDEQAIMNSNYLFMEGFLVSSASGLGAMKGCQKNGPGPRSQSESYLLRSIHGQVL